MENLPNLDELLDYGDEYKFPDLIMSDYYSIDRSKIKNNNQSNSQTQNQNEESKPPINEQKNDNDNKSSNEENNISNEDSNQSEESKTSMDEENNNESSTEENNVSNEDSNQSEDSKTSMDEENNNESSFDDENDFEDLINNYEDDNLSENKNQGNNQHDNSPSDKLNGITTTKIYSVLKKLVSLSYEKWQKGSYKYDKKEIIKHYLTNQKFKIVNDLISPTYKPDVYVFDLSPSNNESLEMYVNAISSLAVKDSLIYLTYNDQILRKLLIKKSNSKGIDVNEIATSNVNKYNNFECTIFDEYRSLYEELREIKDRKIYVFSDFDISLDISKLSQENEDIVWFSTEGSNPMFSIYSNLFNRQFPDTYIGYYVETKGIEDIEKFVMEKNKRKYKRRQM